MVSHTPAIMNLAARWLELSMGESSNTDLRIPTRKEISLRHLARYTRQTSILERRDDGTIGYRVSCTLLDDAVNGHGPEKSLDRFYTDAASEKLEAWMQMLLDKPCGGYLKSEVKTRTGGNAMLELMALPLNSDEGNTRYLITANQLDYENKADAAEGIEPIDLGGLQFSENIDLGWGTPDGTL